MRIGAYYSNGLLYGARLQALRRRYPDAHLSAIVPPGFTMPTGTREIVDEVIETERTHYAPRDLPACLRLVRVLRAGNYDRFVVMFDSVLLNALAMLSGARHPECWNAESRILPMPRTPLGLVYRVLLRNPVCHARYAWVWLRTRQRVLQGPLADGRPVYETRIPPDLRRILRLRLVYRTKAGRAGAARPGATPPTDDSSKDSTP